MNVIKANTKFQVGRVCFMKVSGRPRPFWNLVKITEILKGRDGEVRVIRIKKSDGFITITSVENLYPLELQEEVESNLYPKTSDKDIELEEVLDFPVVKPKRQAAVRARERIRSCI